MSDARQRQIAALQELEKKEQSLRSRIKGLEGYIESLQTPDTDKRSRTLECKLIIDYHDGDYPSYETIRIEKISPEIRDTLIGHCRQQIEVLKRELSDIPD